ncbi:BPSS1780 family membrane protein [Ideonella dechloratans]|uniref:BPSS1780 family membrane protein n=1 Tax=Ideonella dechloratans TaxID=36863 RepID=UPI0035AF1D21
MALILKTVPASQGLVWVRQGLREFARHPLSYTALFMAFMLVGAIVSLLPGFGEVLVLAAIPLLTLAYMMATAASLRGVRPSLSVFVAPWRHLPVERRRGLLTLALGYAFLTLILLMACNLFDHGGVDDLMQGVSRNADPDELQRLADAPGVMAGMLARVTVTLLLSMPFWHAPALVCWVGQSAGTGHVLQRAGPVALPRGHAGLRPGLDGADDARWRGAEPADGVAGRHLADGLAVDAAGPGLDLGLLCLPLLHLPRQLRPGGVTPTATRCSPCPDVFPPC